MNMGDEEKRQKKRVGEEEKEETGMVLEGKFNKNGGIRGLHSQGRAEESNTGGGGWWVEREKEWRIYRKIIISRHHKHKG